MRKRGFVVDIFERSGDELASRGAGITPHKVLFDAFHQAGVGIEHALGVESRGRLFFAADGLVTARNDTPQLFTSWGLLYRFLRREFPDERYFNGTEVTHIEQHESNVILRFKNGSHRPYVWVVGADGLRSTVRRCVVPELEINYTGYVAWRGLMPESLLAKDIAEQLNDRMSFYLPPGEHLLGYTVAGPDDTLTRGQRWYNWVWYRPVAVGDAFRDLFTDTNGKLHANGTAPNLIRPGVSAALRRDARHLLPSQFQAVIRHTGQPFLQPISELGSVQLVYNRAILIGDAAFTVRPHIGLGVSKAAADAATLATAFDQPGEPVSVALKEWERDRLHFGNAVLERSADLGCYLSGDAKTLFEAERFKHYRQAEIVLTGIAAATPEQFLN